jgi:predicted nucleic acid-binding protein
MGVTFDTNALLSSTLWDGSVAQKLLFCLIRKEIGLFTSPSILLEYQNVLKRDFEYSDEEIAKIIEKILSAFKLVVPKYVESLEESSKF